jgi:hypothetical protein
MTQDKDKIQQAADALEALGSGAAPAGPPEEPALEAPAQPPAPVPPKAPAEQSLVRVVARGQQKKAGPAKGDAPTGPAAPAKVEPPPKLTPLAKANLNRKIALQRTLIPILLSTALAMVLLGVWSVVVLVGGGEVTSQTRYPARLMLLAWPIAVILLAGTAFLMHEVYSHFRIHQPQQPAADPKRD